MSYKINSNKFKTYKIMKKINYLFSAMSLLALAACSSDNNEEYGRDLSTARQIVPVTQISENTTRASQDLQATSIAKDVKVRFLVTEANSTTISNQSLLTSNGSNSFSESETNLYYPVSGSADIYGYAPATETTVSDLTADQTFEIKTDQSSDENYLASDLLIGSKTGVTTPTDESSYVVVTFKHALTKLNLNIEESLKPSTVKISNTKTACTFNISTGAVTATGSAGSVTAATLSGSETATDGYYKFSAIIIPQEFSTNATMLEITTTDGDTYTYTPSSKMTAAGSTEYNYKVTANSTTKQVSMLLQSEVTDWTSTDEQKAVVEKAERTAHVGDWYTAEGKYADGSTTAPKNTIGIVFSTTVSDADKTAGYTCYVSALTDLANKAFATKDTEAATAAINGEDNFITKGADALNALNGLSLTTTLKGLSNYSDFTAFNNALTSYDDLYKAPATVSSGWFIPSIGQMAQLAAYVYGGTQTGSSSSTTITPSDDTSAGYDNTDCAKKIAQLVTAGVITYNSSTAFLNGGTAYVEVTDDAGTVTSKTSDPSYLTITEKTVTNIWTINFNQSKVYAFSTSNGKTASKRVHLILAAK